ncbi:hypothetical protein [Hydrogenophaga sp. 5NK40-0174]|uniref:hypothetical protein n=1 Tax=Hydrogenophaga sp. 5NK40-0174 TaxID=3127649 RepID=UPI0031085CF0
MKKLVQTLVLGCVLTVLVTWSLTLLHRDRYPHYDNVRVLNDTAVSEMVVYGPVQPGFTLRQPVDTTLFNIQEPGFNDLQACVVVFLDQTYDSFESAPMQVTLRRGFEQTSTTLETADVENKFMRICLPQSRLGNFTSGKVEIELHVPNAPKRDVAKVILTKLTAGEPAVINGKETAWKLPHSIEVHRKLSTATIRQSLLLVSFPSFMLATLIVYLLPLGGRRPQGNAPVPPARPQI